MAKKLLIMGAAGKDFHVFNTIYRDNADFEIVAFTATQIPDIDDRKYPAELAGKLYPDGIAIYPEEQLAELIKKFEVEEVIFAYSDVNYETWIGPRRKIVEDAGAKFSYPDHFKTFVKSTKPVIAVTAVRTGSGKSQTTRKIATMLREMGYKVSAARHPMPYGDLAAQKVQRFGELADLVKHKCTIEEIEEYEPHIASGGVIYAGVDYEAILREAEKEGDIVLWDGGNNDTPFFAADLWMVVADPLRPGDELTYFPSDVNFKNAHVIIINKMDSATPEGIKIIEDNAKKYNPNAIIVYADSKVTIDDPEALKGKRVLVVEDGPTCTHGMMKTGAGTVAAERFGAAEIVDPRPFLKGKLADTFVKYPNVGKLLPAMGYSDQQIKDLEDTINASDVDMVVIGTPIDLGRIIKINKPSVRVQYDLDEKGKPDMESILADFLKKHNLTK